MNKYMFSALVMAAMIAAGCTKKKETSTIITKIETPKVSNTVKVIGDSESTKTIDWDGTYTVTIARKADRELPVIKDEDGNRYYDNAIKLTVEGPKGTVFSREYRKSDFNSYIDTNYLKPSKSALMSIAFNRAEGSKTIFVATIGSPDTMADEYMLVRMELTKGGAMTMSKIQETE